MEGDEYVTNAPRQISADVALTDRAGAGGRNLSLGLKVHEKIYFSVWLSSLLENWVFSKQEMEQMASHLTYLWEKSWECMWKAEKFGSGAVGWQSETASMVWTSSFRASY